MVGVTWTATELDAAVADYFVMLSAELRAEPYVKARHRKALLNVVNHSEGSIEFLHRNISAILRGMGEEWIKGYRPAHNYALALEDAVERWLVEFPNWLTRAPRVQADLGLQDGSALWVGTAPTLRNGPEPDELEQTQRVARKFDVAARDERNRALGRMGEQRVLEHERNTLIRFGRGDLAKRVRWVSDVDGDGAGYDISSYDTNGRQRLIEVKTTRGWERTPFHLSRNELEVSRERPDSWCLMRLWNFERDPKAFELRPPLEAHVSLMPTSYQASFS